MVVHASLISQSDEKEIDGSSSKEGSALVRFVQAAHTAVKCDDYFGNLYT